MDNILMEVKAVSYIVENATEKTNPCGRQLELSPRIKIFTRKTKIDIFGLKRLKAVC